MPLSRLFAENIHNFLLDTYNTECIDFFVTASFLYSQILVVNQESLQLEQVVLFYKTQCGSHDLKQGCITEPREDC